MNIFGFDWISSTKTSLCTNSSIRNLLFLLPRVKQEPTHNVTVVVFNEDWSPSLILLSMSHNILMIVCFELIVKRWFLRFQRLFVPTDEAQSH